MKKTLLSITLGLLLGTAYAQEEWRALLATDPLKSNGYFILDPEKVTSMGIVTVNVEIIADKVDGNGQVQHRNLQSFTITDGHYGNLDVQALSGLEANETFHYEVVALNGQGQVVGDVSSVPQDHQWWPEACRTHCVSSHYSWDVVCYTLFSQTVMELQNGSGEDIYFYVPEWDNQWSQFKQAHPNPSEFGLTAPDWNWYETYQEGPFNGPQTEVFEVATIPPGAVGYNGYNIGSITGPGWAIRKDAGPWREVVYTATELYTQPSEVCDNLVDIWNDDPLITADRLSHTPPVPSLACSPLPQGGGGVSWGDSGPFNPCTEIPVPADGNIFGWAVLAIDCFTEPVWTDQDISDVHAISVNRWNPNGVEPVLHAVLPTENDPRLVPVPRTPLAPGLYEFLIVMDDGRIVRHFEESDGSLVLTADFTAFVDINVYPVPVIGQTFAIDLDLAYPASISLSIVNNTGTPYHNKELEFALAGLNKHIVEMQTQWPAGIYHAVFLYVDGSSESVSFTVEEN